MYNRSANLQVTHSLMALSDALFELLRAKPIQNITVTELCGRASVTRRTYYRNVEDIVDLVDYRIDRSIAELIVRTDYDETDEGILYHNFFEYWYARRGFLAILYARGLFPRFVDRFVDLCVRGPVYYRLRVFLQLKDDAEPFQPFHSAYVVGGFCTVLLYWVRDNFETPIDVLTETVSAFTPSAGA